MPASLERTLMCHQLTGVPGGRPRHEHPARAAAGRPGWGTATISRKPAIEPSCVELGEPSGTFQQVSDALQLTIRYEPGEDGWIVASIPEVPGAISQGGTREEARANVIDALRLMLKPEPDAPPSDSEPLKLTIAA